MSAEQMDVAANNLPLVPVAPTRSIGAGPLVIAALAVLTVWFGFGVWLYLDPDRGTFGDMFGAVNALFSGLAFAALVYTVFLQREELRLQRIELSETRLELRGQKEQLAAQNAVLAVQGFDSTFFALLGLLNRLVEEIDLRKSDRSNVRVTSGKDTFKVFFDRLSVEFRNAVGSDHKEMLESAYRSFYDQNDYELGHYFRTLYNLVKYVHEKCLGDKTTYTNIIRAQLSSYELLLLFYNCLSYLGREKFKPLIEQYQFFKTLPVKRLFSESDLELYSQSAYGVRPEFRQD